MKNRAGIYLQTDIELNVEVIWRLDQNRQEIYLILGVCILSRVWDQVMGGFICLRNVTIVC
jgi:hypothetical protein